MINDFDLNNNPIDQLCFFNLSLSYLFSLKIKKVKRIYPLSIKAMITDKPKSKSSDTSTKAVDNLAKFPKTDSPTVIIDKLPVAFSLWI